MRQNGKPKEYKIGEREYILTPLVLAQLIDLAKFFAKLEIDLEKFESLRDFLSEYLEHLPLLCAIVLKRKDVPLRERDIHEEAEYIAENMDMDTAVRVVEDFFRIQDLSSLAQKVTALIQAMTGQLTGERSQKE